MECGAKFEAPEELGERRVLTILFADLSGFTAFSEGSDVEDVRALAQEAADRLSEIVDHYGGTVDKIIGDAVMAVWGAPVTHEDDAERAVRAALDMQTVVANRSEKFFGLALSTGLYTGEAIWSPIGPDGRYTALGDSVNTAARLQGAAGKGEILVGEETYRLSADAIDYEAVEPIKAKNKAEPVPAWKALAVKGARRAAPVLPMVGRQTELDRFWELWELVRTERTPYLATVVGNPGIGKSRLIRGLGERIGDAARIWWGRCLDYGEGITYWPIIEMVKTAAGIELEDSSEEASRKLGVLLESLGSEDLDELRTMAVAMANLIAAPTTPRGTYSATEITKGELEWGIRRVFQILAQQRPVVLVFDDLHNAEPALLDLVTSFIDVKEDAPILVFAAARPEVDLERLAAPHNVRRFELGALSQDEGHQLVANMVGTADVADGPLGALLERAAGNPLFLEETVRMLVDAGALDDEGRVIPEKIAALSIPSNLRALIEARLDRLTGSQKRTAGRASIVGQTFWSGAVAYLDGNGDDTASTVYEVEIDQALFELEDRDVVQSKTSSTFSEQREWDFRHALIRDVAYDRIPKNERARLHERCGRWIAARSSSDEFVEIVAYHLEQSCLLAREIARTTFAPPVIDAARALTRAAEKAESREGTAEAIRFYARALELLGGSFPETATELNLRHARSLPGLGRHDEAYEELERVAQQCIEIGRADLRCRSLVTMADIDRLHGRLDAARSKIEEAEQIARDLDDPSLRIRTALIQSGLHQGSVQTAQDEIRRAIALAEEIEDSEFMLTGQMKLGVLHYNTGNLPEAEAAFRRSAELAQEQGSLRHLAWITAFLGLARLHCGPRDQAADDLAQASEWLERTGDTFTLTQVLMWRANLELARDNVRNAVRLLRVAMPLARKVAGGVFLPQVSRALVEAFVRQDRIPEAREVANEASSRGASQHGFAQAGVLIAEAFVQAAEGDEVGARERFADALPLLEGDDIEFGEAVLSEARMLTLIGDTSGAYEKLTTAREVFERVGATATIDDIDREIESFAPAKVRAIRGA